MRLIETGEEIQLSHNGHKFYDYASSLPEPTAIPMFQRAMKYIDPPMSGSWSPDSKKLVVCRIDQRESGWLHIVNPVPEQGVRPVLHSFVYPLAGEPNVPRAELHIFDVENKTQVKVDTEPIPMLYYDYGSLPEVRWKKDSRSFTFAHMERGCRRYRLQVTDAETGKTHTFIEERSDTCVNPDNTYFRFINYDSEIIWSSERDGWCHLYLYDVNTGQLKNQITKGPWVVRYILRVDEDARQIYFAAGGREKGRDPYLSHVYRINTDGTGLLLLTPANGHHQVEFSPDGKYLVDTYSRVDMPPVSELRRVSDAKLICTLERSDIDLLLQTGWKPPEPFSIRARDGKTDVYGVVFRPTNLDPGKKYPVVEDIYTGPHSFHVPKHFSTFPRRQALAELGFIVVMVDGLGTGMRSKQFHNYSYKNLGDAGLEEHIAAIKHLAAKYPYVDATRVGLYGCSAGGYDAAHALLTHPEFYKVAVSISGNHDHRLDKACWVELWMGYPIGPHYIEQSNVTLADKLQGKLLLLHGDMDDNVHLSSTLRFADALIKANKDFDVIIAPNTGHCVRGNYFTRKRWDYFVKHLLGVEPPKGFKIGD